MISVFFIVLDLLPEVSPFQYELSKLPYINRRLLEGSEDSLAQLIDDVQNHGVGSANFTTESLDEDAPAGEPSPRENKVC